MWFAVNKDCFLAQFAGSITVTGGETTLIWVNQNSWIFLNDFQLFLAMQRWSVNLSLQHCRVKYLNSYWIDFHKICIRQLWSPKIESSCLILWYLVCCQRHNLHVSLNGSKIEDIITSVITLYLRVKEEDHSPSNSLHSVTHPGYIWCLKDHGHKNGCNFISKGLI